MKFERTPPPSYEEIARARPEELRQLEERLQTDPYMESLPFYVDGYTEPVTENDRERWKAEAAQQAAAQAAYAEQHRAYEESADRDFRTNISCIVIVVVLYIVIVFFWK